MKTIITQVLAILALFSSVNANPALNLGTWVDITPPGGMGQYINDIQFDPSNHDILYVCVCQGSAAGLQKSTDGGSTWIKISGTQLNSPQRVRIDPNDGNHLYVTQGVSATGFYISHDGGATMIRPAGWAKLMDTIQQENIYYIAVDPSDFNHVLVVFYVGWNGTGNAGIVESKDGGETWIVHNPLPEWDGGHLCNITFLFNPALGLGDKSTWLFSAQPGGVGGMWRTTNSGQTWSKVASYPITRAEYYYTSTGVLYAAAIGYPLKSMDNGVTWQQITGAPNDYYYSIQGDGNLLYTLGARGGPFYTASEANPATWTPMNSQNFCEGSATLTFDPENRIMYSAGKTCGVWALKVGVISTKTSPAPSLRQIRNSTPCSFTGKRGLVIRGNAGLFNVKGMRMLKEQR